MKLYLVFILLYSAFAYEEPLVKYLKRTIVKSKYPLLNTDKFLEIYDLEPGKRDQARFFGFFCHFNEASTTCKQQIDNYLNNYDRVESRNRTETLQPRVLNLDAYTYLNDCAIKLGAICPEKTGRWPSTTPAPGALTPCANAVYVLCAYYNNEEYGKQYVAFRDEAEQRHQEWARFEGVLPTTPNSKAAAGPKG